MIGLWCWQNLLRIAGMIAILYVWLIWFFHLSLPTFDICYKMRASSKTWKVRLHKSLASSSWFYKLFLRSPNSLHGFWRGWIKHNWDELTFFQINIEIFSFSKCNHFPCCVLLRINNNTRISNWGYLWFWGELWQLSLENNLFET